MWVRFGIDRLEEDLKKSYQFSKCAYCKEYYDVRKTGPIIISDEIFSDDIVDEGDPYMTIDNHIFGTNFGELIIDEKIHDLLINNEVTGLEFEDVRILQAENKKFYQLIVKDEIGAPVFPGVKKISHCSKCEKTVLVLQTAVSRFEAPFYSCAFFGNSWHNWSDKFEKGEHYENDILKLKSYGPNEIDSSRRIISRKLYQILKDSRIDEFFFSPAEIWPSRFY
jgi:hypothetical protein